MLKVYDRPRDYEGMVVCVSCGHNIRNGKGGNRCEIDGHYIGYVSNFTQWCRRWTHDKKWNEVTEC